MATAVSAGEQHAACLDLRALDEGESVIERTIDGGLIGLASDDIELTGALAVSLQVRRVGGSVEIHGRVGGEVAETCARCARAFRRAFDEWFYLVGIPASPESTANEPESDDYVTHDGVCIDLSGPIREAVLLSRPMAAVCRETCRGLCPVCGVDLNETRCDCVRSEPDPRWQAIRDHLENLKSKDS